jgi:anti-anti-sigma regulatory factor
VGGVVIRVAGHLDDAAAAELRAQGRVRPGAPTVDLEHVVSMDAASIAALRALRDEGARVIGASRYIRLLLDGDGAAGGEPQETNPSMEEE